MIVSHARQFIFFHNSKCAGTSMRAALADYHDDPFSFWSIFPAPFFRNHIDHTHLRLWEMQVLFPHIIRAAQTYRSVIFVQNPYRQFLSVLDEHFKKFQPSVQLATRSRPDQARVIEAFIDKILRSTKGRDRARICIFAVSYSWGSIATLTPNVAFDTVHRCLSAH